MNLKEEKKAQLLSASVCLRERGWGEGKGEGEEGGGRSAQTRANPTSTGYDLLSVDYRCWLDCTCVVVVAAVVAAAVVSLVAVVASVCSHSVRMVTGALRQRLWIRCQSNPHRRHFNVILMSFWCHLDVIWTSFWCHSDVIWTQQL